MSVKRDNFIPASGRELSPFVDPADEVDAAARLRDLLLDDYSNLLCQLARRVGSRDLAGEALAQCYLRLLHAPLRGPLRNPRAYLVRIVLNIAFDLRRIERRQPVAVDLARLLDIPDDRPDSARIVEDRAEVALLREALAELPERRRQVLILARLEDRPKREIAALLGVTVRTVETDLKQAVEHCAARMRLARPKKNPPGRFASADSQSSQSQHAFDSFGSSGEHFEKIARTPSRRLRASSSPLGSA